MVVDKPERNTYQTRLNEKAPEMLTFLKERLRPEHVKCFKRRGEGDSTTFYPHPVETCPNEICSRIRELIEAIDGPLPPAFAVLYSTHFRLSVCSSLGLNETIHKVQSAYRGPSKTREFAQDESFETGEHNPHPCAHYPKTHSHYLFR